MVSKDRLAASVDRDIYDSEINYYKENPYDIISKVEDNTVLENVLKDLQKAENDLLNEIRFCQDHKMDMEAAPLRYKCNAFEQVRRIIYKHEED